MKNKPYINNVQTIEIKMFVVDPKTGAGYGKVMRIADMTDVEMSSLAKCMEDIDNFTDTKIRDCLRLDIFNGSISFEDIE